MASNRQQPVSNQLNTAGEEEDGPGGSDAAILDTRVSTAIVPIAQQESRSDRNVRMRQEAIARVAARSLLVVESSNDLQGAMATHVTNSASAQLAYENEVSHVKNNPIEAMSTSQLSQLFLTQQAEVKFLREQMKYSNDLHNATARAALAGNSYAVDVSAPVAMLSLLSKKNQNAANLLEVVAQPELALASGPGRVFKSVDSTLFLQDTQSHSARQASDSIRRFTTAPEASVKTVADDGQETDQTPFQKLKNLQGEKLNYEKTIEAGDLVDSIIRDPKRTPSLKCVLCNASLKYSDIQLNITNVLDSNKKPRRDFVYTFPSRHPQCHMVQQGEQSSIKYAQSKARRETKQD
jgi:hypothetical protein